MTHRIPLDGTAWSVWRDVCLRSAGFPADMMLAVCSEPSEEGYPDAVRRLSLAIADVNADPFFREAVTWQNPALAQRLRDAGAGTARRTKERQRELTIANYLQRYCLKNDTIGFFGPVGWASVAPGIAGLVVTPGRDLVARRTTHFEVWAIDKVAAAIAAQGRVLGWLRPQRIRSAYLAGNVLHRAHRKPVVLTDSELRILLACDGSATISDVVASAGPPEAGPAEAGALLARLVELGALRLDLEGPVSSWPERLLRERLGQIADPAARTAALEPLERMIKARDTVAACAGDPDRLHEALESLAQVFEEVTGSPATRRAGMLYAGRTLVYQDARRDVRVELGAAVTGALASPLALVLDSARWLLNDITARFRALFAQLLDREIARAGGAPVPLQRLLIVASPYLGDNADGRRLSEIVAASTAELQRRWQVVLGPTLAGRRHQFRADAIAARVADCFPGHPVAWSGARQHSPDIMTAASSPGDVLRGDFLLVLGELHLAHNTLDGRLFVGQHPDPARLIAAEQADHGARRIVSIPAKDFSGVTSRTSPPSALMGPGQVYWTAAGIDSLDPPEPATVIPAAAMTVTRRGDDLVVHLMSSGAELDFFEVVGDLIGGAAMNGFQPVAPGAHRPRITIDRLVLSREQWVFKVADSGWAFVQDEQERYYRARRWRREQQLPERVFIRVPVEAKPVAADFRSIVLVNLFAKHVRQTHAAGHAEYSVSEMLPDLDQLWLTDHAGRRYSCELRFVAFDGG
jgi:Lantibiotic dehydratase, N terminus